MDHQNRVGSKPGSGGNLSESQSAVDRRERLRKLAMETIDLAKDPYLLRNHLGMYECRLCLTLHRNEANYLAHTQGRRHQNNLAKRAFEESQAGIAPRMEAKARPVRSTIRIGRPGYKVTKSRDPRTRQRTLIFEVQYPDAEDGLQPRHRFMSAFEQRVEAADKRYQYLLFACDPYEIIGFKIPSEPLDKGEGRFVTNWDRETKKFTLQLYFMEEDENGVATA